MTEDKGILIRNIYYMLTYAFRELRQNNYEDIAGEEFENIHDLFAEILSRGIAYQLKQGLHREYVTRKENLSTLKGKLDIGGTIRQKMRKSQQLTCEYDDFSEDCLFNQILKITSFALINHPDVKRQRKQSLRKLMLYFSSVADTDIHSTNWTTLRFDRDSAKWEGGTARWQHPILQHP